MSHSDFIPTVNRRKFLQTTTAGVAALAAGAAIPGLVSAKDKKPADSNGPEAIVEHLYDSLTPKQKEDVTFDWNFKDPKRGLLRTRVANNWQVTKPVLDSDYYTSDQQKMVRDIFEGLVSEEWIAKFDQQLQDDAGGFGAEQAIAIFGKPGTEQFEFVLTGRHMTMRCDGNSAEHVAFGGPIFYGHAASGFNEGPDHVGSVFWHQALKANNVYKILDGKQQKQALHDKTPREQNSGFQGKDGNFTGIPIADLSGDQKEAVEDVLKSLVEPYRQKDRDEVAACLKTMGGLDACHLTFYSDKDIGNDKVWDNWRLEGPSFVWHFRGNPHVHVWVNVADSPEVKLNA